MLGLPAPPTGGAGPHDEDAREVIAFSRSYAGKLEEVKDLVNEKEKQGDAPHELSEEQKLAEDKKTDYIEEKVMLPKVTLQDPHMVDEARNQAKPSAPATTPRSPAQKSNFPVDGEEGDPKRMKLSPGKAVHKSEGESSESRRD